MLRNPSSAASKLSTDDAGSKRCRYGSLFFCAGLHRKVAPITNLQISPTGFFAEMKPDPRTGWNDTSPPRSQDRMRQHKEGRSQREESADSLPGFPIPEASESLRSPAPPFFPGSAATRFGVFDEDWPMPPLFQGDLKGEVGASPVACFGKRPHPVSAASLNLNATTVVSSSGCALAGSESEPRRRSQRGVEQRCNPGGCCPGSADNRRFHRSTGTG